MGGCSHAGRVGCWLRGLLGPEPTMTKKLRECGMKFTQFKETERGGVSFSRLGNLALMASAAALMLGCSSGGGGSSPSFTVGGELVGLADGETVTLDDGEQTQELGSDGVFALPTTYGNGDDYSITVSEQPASQGCAIENATGTIDGEDVDTLLVECRDPAQATADPRSQKLLIDWAAESDTSYNLYWSTDPALEPENYASFDNSGIAEDIQPPYTLEGLENTRNYYLYLESEFGTSRHSERFGTRPMAATVNGSVVAMQTDNAGNLYLGGNFQAVGYNAGGLIALDRGTELPTHSAHIGGLVTAIEPDGTGGFYVGGVFFHADGQEANNILRLNADLSVDTSWGVSTDGTIYTLVAEDDRLLIGGTFEEVNGFARQKLAAVNHDGDLLGWTADVGGNGLVFDLTPTDDHIIVGGAFSTIGGETRENLAALLPNGDVDTTWQADTDAQVTRIHREAETLYMVGNFETVGGANRVVAAAVDTDGNVLSFDPGITSGRGTNVTVINDVIYIGGDFDGPSSNLLAVDDTGAPVSIPAGEPNGQVTLVRELDGDILVSGIFTEIGGTTRTGLALLNDQGELQDGLDVGIQAAFDLHADAETLLFGSISLPNYRMVEQSNLAKFTSDGDLASWETGLNGRVESLALHGDTLYAGGSFTETDSGVARDHLAAFDPATGDLDDTWTPQADDTVWAMAARNGEIHVGGSFNNINGTARNHLATLDTAGQTIDRLPEADGPVTTISRDGGNLYLGGDFSNIDGNARIKVGAVDSTNGDLLAWAPTLTESSTSSMNVNTIDVFSGNVYIGGQFDQAEGSTRLNLAAYDTAGSLLNWQPDPDDRVTALLANSSGIRVGGWFTEIGGTAANRLARVDTNGDAVVTLEGGLPGAANTMLEVDGGFCFGVDNAAIMNDRVIAGIACMDDDLNWLW